MRESLRIDSPFMGAGMPKAYSRDLRERVITAVETGASRREAAERFEVSVASAVKWLQRWYQQRSAAPEAARQGSVSPVEEFAVEILDLIAQRPDLTLVETVARTAQATDQNQPQLAAGVFSTDTTSRSKKVLQAAERQRADVAQARRRWIREQGMLDPARLVFIDETAVSTNMVRLRGRAPPVSASGVIGAVPLGRWETITFVAALRHNKMVAPMVVEGAMTGEMFLAYVENCLVPTLRRNDIVVMDNFPPGPSGDRHWPGYRNSGRDTALPAEIFARPQSHRRCLTANSRHSCVKWQPRTIPSLNRAIRSFIPQLSPQECANYFRHAGYVSNMIGIRFGFTAYDLDAVEIFAKIKRAWSLPPHCASTMSRLLRCTLHFRCGSLSRPIDPVSPAGSCPLRSESGRRPALPQEMTRRATRRHRLVRDSMVLLSHFAREL